MTDVSRRDGRVHLYSRTCQEYRVFKSSDARQLLVYNERPFDAIVVQEIPRTSDRFDVDTARFEEGRLTLLYSFCITVISGVV